MLINLLHNYIIVDALGIPVKLANSPTISPETCHLILNDDDVIPPLVKGKKILETLFLRLVNAG